MSNTYYGSAVDPTKQMPQFYRDQFTATITTLYGAYRSKFDHLPKISKTSPSGNAAELLKRFGHTQIEERDLTIRNDNTPNMGTETLNVTIEPRTAAWGTLVEDEDILKMGQDPKSQLVVNALGHMQATMDRYFMEGILKNTVVSKSDYGASKTVKFPTDTIVPYDNGQNVAPIGLTPNKIQKAVNLLKIKDVAGRFSHERPTVIVSPNGWNQLISDDRMINRNYGHEHVLATGKLPPYLGCEFMEYNGNFPTKEVTYNSTKYVVKKIPVFYPSAIGKCKWLGDRPVSHCAPDPAKRFQNRIYIQWIGNYTWVDPDGVGYIECYEPL